jgi:hypothetical protein
VTGSDGMPIPEASEARPRRQPHEIVAAQKLSAGQQVAKMQQRAAAAIDGADGALASGAAKVATSDKAQVGRIYAQAAKQETAGDVASGRMPALQSMRMKAEQELLDGVGQDASEFTKAVKQMLGQPGAMGESRAKLFYNFVMAQHNESKAERKINTGRKASQLADFNAGVIQRKIERRRGAAKTIEERTRAAAAKLSATKKPDTDEGDQQLLDEGLAAFFGKKAAGAGDIALYLKRLFNEDHEPDDEDIACLAGVLSTALEDSEEEGADEGLAAAEDAAKQAQDARVKKLSEPELEPEKPEQSEKSEPPEKPTVKQSEKPEQAVYEELPPGLYMADLLRDERVQAVLRKTVGT